MKLIQSSKNEKVKQWKKLHTKKEREKTGLFLVEGEHLVKEAIQAKQIKELMITERYREKFQDDASDYTIYIISKEVEKAIAETETPQGIFAICEQQTITNVSGNRFLLIDAVQDPGNVGTMIRTADACGFDAVILGNGSVDPYNGKVVRSAQGSHFHIPIIRGDLYEWVDELQANGIHVFGTALEGAESIYDIEKVERFALIVGNEGQGVQKELLEKTTKNIYIPIFGQSESLNVSVAAGILMYFLRG